MLENKCRSKFGLKQPCALVLRFPWRRCLGLDKHSLSALSTTCVLLQGTCVLIMYCNKLLNIKVYL